MEVRGGRGDEVLVVLAAEIFGAPVERRFQRGILIEFLCVDRQLRLAIEEERDRILRAEIPAQSRHLVPHVGDGARRIVGECSDHHRDAARTVALVRDFLIVDALELARTFLDRALDVVLRHRTGLCGLDGSA